MEIPKAKPSDFGAYECLAKNSNGQATSVVHVIECKYFDILKIQGNLLKYIFKLVKPSVRPSVEIRVNGDDELNIGDAIDITCRITGGEPTPSLVWRRLPDGQQLSKNAKIIQSPGIKRSLGLRIDKAEISDFGTYSCFANNSAGESNALKEIIKDNRTVPTVKIFNGNAISVVEGLKKKHSINI